MKEFLVQSQRRVCLACLLILAPRLLRFCDWREKHDWSVSSPFLRLPRRNTIVIVRCHLDYDTDEETDKLLGLEHRIHAKNQAVRDAVCWEVFRRETFEQGIRFSRLCPNRRVNPNLKKVKLDLILWRWNSLSLSSLTRFQKLTELFFSLVSIAKKTPSSLSCYCCCAWNRNRNWSMLISCFSFLVPTQLIVDPENSSVLIEGVLFRCRYLGSTQLLVEGNPTKASRMVQAQEAVGRIKAPQGETQPSVEVDLFISTEKIMVLNTDLQDILMDHSLRSISYIGQFDSPLSPFSTTLLFRIV